MLRNHLFYIFRQNKGAKILNRQLEIFVKTAESESFARTAVKCNKTPQAIQKQIVSLEDRLGVVLFHRSSTGISLTPAGKSFYYDARKILLLLEEAAERAKKAGGGQDNLVRFGISPLTPMHFLSALWPEVQKICPGIRVQFVPFDNKADVARDILMNMGERIDFVAGVYDQDFLDRYACGAYKFKDVPIEIGMSMFHPLAFKEKLTFRDLKGLKILVQEKPWMASYDRAKEVLLQRTVVKPISYPFLDVITLNRCQMTDDLLLGVNVWTESVPLLKFVPIDWEYTIPFGLMHSLKPNAGASLLLESLGKLPACPLRTEK